MLTTRDLLAVVKTAHGIPSNYRLARVLDVTEATVQRWNTGRNAPDDAMAERLANMAGLDVAYVLASIYAERAANDDSRRIWSGIAKRLQGLAAAVAAVMVSALLGVTGSDPAMAATARSVAQQAPSVHYVKSLARLLAALARAAQARRVRIRAWLRNHHACASLTSTIVT